MPFGCCSKPIKGSFLPKPQRHYLSAQGSHTFALLLITLLEQSSKSYANAKFPSAGSPRTLGAFCFKVFNTPLLAMLQRLRSCACTLCESAKFCSAEGSRTFALLLITPLKQSSKDYALVLALSVRALSSAQRRARAPLVLLAPVPYFL
jgi:hypothetical protein